MTEIKLDMLDAIKVQFLKPIFEEDFPERGMKAWLTKIEKHDKYGCYKLYFDFSEFEEENDKYFTEKYFHNSKVSSFVKSKALYTAKEAGYYSPKYDVFFGRIDESEEKFETEIKKYLKVID